MSVLTGVLFENCDLSGHLLFFKQCSNRSTFRKRSVLSDRSSGEQSVMIGYLFERSVLTGKLEKIDVLIGHIFEVCVLSGHLFWKDWRCYRGVARALASVTALSGMGW